MALSIFPLLWVFLGLVYSLLLTRKHNAIVRYANLSALSSKSLGPTISGIGRGSRRRKPSMILLMERIYSPSILRMLLCLGDGDQES